jgi:light-regulated signal transduction histidine kinase (bacteriophytochrome)
VILANGQAAELLGVRSTDDLVGRAWMDFVHSEDRSQFGESASKETGDELRQAQEVREFRIAPPGGGETWVRAQEVRTEFRRRQSTLIFLTLIAEQERVEDQIQKLGEEFDSRVSERTTQLEVVNKELEAFAYSVSHDLRAPLRSIEGFSQILLEDYAHWLDTQGRDYIQRVRSSARRMAQLVDDLLNFSRVTRSEMVRDAVDLTATAQAIVTELGQGQPERQAEFIIAPNLKSNGDARLLRLALDNLMGNAWKFTRKRPRTRIEFGSAQADGQTAYFVRDNGVGFDMAYSDKLFDGFQRLHSPADYEGTGIGLTTVQRIIGRHGGRIWADSAVDQGATFYFTLSTEEGVP